MKRLLLLLSLLCFLFAPFLTQAQTAIDNTFGIGPRVGYYQANDADEGSFYFGLQTRARLGAVVGLEGSIEYRTGQESSFNVGGVDQSVTTKFVPITASLMLFLPVGPYISPYGLAGVGAYYTIYDYDGDFADANDDEFNFGYHLGFGLEFPISENVALNFDYRYLFLNPDQGETSTDQEDYNYDGNVFTGGIMFYL